MCLLAVLRDLGVHDVNTFRRPKMMVWRSLGARSPDANVESLAMNGIHLHRALWGIEILVIRTVPVTI